MQTYGAVRSLVPREGKNAWAEVEGEPEERESGRLILMVCERKITPRTSIQST